MTSKRITLILVGMFCAWCMMWLTLGAWYCVPNAEDLSVSAEAIERGFLASVQGLLISYDGRYFTNVLHALNPLVWGWYGGYSLMPLFGIMAIVLSLWLLLASLKVEKGWHGRAILLSLSFTMVHLSVTPSLPHDLYWMISSFVFMWPWAFFFLFVAALLRYVQAPEGRLRNVWFLVCVAAMVCGIGMNEMFLVLYCFVLATMLLAMIRGGGRRTLSLAPLLVAGISSIIFFVTCPGISQRMGDQDVVLGWGHAASVVSVSFQHLMSFFNEAWFGNLTVLPWVIVSSALLPQGLRSRLSDISWPRLVLWTAVGFCCIWAMTWAYYWPMGTEAVKPLRVHASLSYAMQLGLWFFMARTLSGVGHAGPSVSQFLKRLPVLPFLAGLMCIGVLFLPNNIAEIQREYAVGMLSCYKEQMTDRHLILKNASRERTWNVVTVPPISCLPTTVFHPPLLYPDRYQGCWNRAYERYYMLDEVRLSSDTVTKLGILLSDGQK